MEQHDYLIVGLGNPGEQYHLTRHNLGYLVVAELAARWGAGPAQEKWQSLYYCSKQQGAKIHLLQPLTYMNRSGQAVTQFLRFFKISFDHLLVVHDDLDMRPGRVKLVKGGGTAGHNGLRSLVEWLGTGDFYRLKIGIGRPGQGEIHRDYPVERYVLGGMSAEEQALLQERYPLLAEGIGLFLQGDPARAMGLLNALKG
jgi:peptidyl-tRNA hydrolase, PTH1 family